MTRYGARFRLYAWLSVFITLFSAVSPGLAAVVLTDRPAALGQMLGLPAPPRAAQHQHHSVDHAARHGEAGEHDANLPPPDDGAAHDAHGIYCSFCLSASSTVALGILPPALAVLSMESSALVIERARPPAVAFHPFFRSRAPPFSAPLLL
ncbi:MAG: hypothetical protein JWO70_2390 [Betaproteobacteria bacterium]|jgi:hypothetical protein|nr:hypothetical protein [Betaproteobacteria bacterium]